MSNKNYGWVFWKVLSPRAKLADDAKLAGTTKLETLVRELIQNAVDAAKKNEQVKLVVEDGQLALSDVWDALKLEEIEAHIKGTLDFVGEESTNRIVPKCKGQLTFLSSPRCRYLKFSDYNTKGLEGINKFDKTKAIWKLLFDDGTSAGKKSSSAGGVGVGKNATFPFSQISTVLYSTKTDEGYGLVGSSHLNSSMIDGITFEPEGNLVSYDDYEKVSLGECDSIHALSEECISSISSNIFKRDENGSDVIILGTDNNSALSDPDWGKRFALLSVINFCPAILDEMFSLEIKQFGKPPIVLNKNSIEEVVDELESDEETAEALDDLIRDARLVLKTLTFKEENENCRIVKQTNPILGDFELRMNALPEVGCKRWQLFRSFGMKTITRDIRCQRPVFSIARILNKEGSDYLLSAESGNHTEYDFQQLGEKGKEVQSVVSSFERWVAQEIGHFGRVDSSQTDIELAGLTNFIALSDDLKISGKEGVGAKPTLELGNAPQTNNKSKKKQRKRDTTKSDPDGQLLGIRKEQWNHNDDSHKNWENERDTKEIEVPVSADGKRVSYNRLVPIKATFRDVHLPYSSKVELIGKIANSVYKQKRIDISVLAVNEQGAINDYLPKIKSAIDLSNGEVISSIEGNHLIKGVLVGDDLTVHLEISFAAPFRSSLIESASTIQHIEQSKQKEEIKDESTK